MALNELNDVNKKKTTHLLCLISCFTYYCHVSSKYCPAKMNRTVKTLHTRKFDSLGKHVKTAAPLTITAMMPFYRWQFTSIVSEILT